jgi:Na+-transporting NADH:ubiquinone oxidoreductase subunit C
VKRNKTKERIHTVAFMFAATLITVSAVSALHIATLDLVERNQDLFIRKAVLKAARIELPNDPAKISELYDEIVSPVPDVPDCYMIGSETGKCVFIRSGPGLWGEIKAVVCFDTQTDTLVGVTFTKQNETPGLGARIEESWFQEQFFGKKGVLSLVPEGSRSKETDKIDAITGATITSKAVRDIVNASTEEAKAMAARQRERN